MMNDSKINDHVAYGFEVDDDLLFTIRFEDLSGKPCFVDIMRNDTPGYDYYDPYILLFDVGEMICGSFALQRLYAAMDGKFSLRPVSLSKIKQIFYR